MDNSIPNDPQKLFELGPINKWIVQLSYSGLLGYYSHVGITSNPNEIADLFSKFF